MKIFFCPLMPVQMHDASSVSDYQSDMVFHGLVKTLGKDLHTSHKMWWHHKKEKESRPEEFKRIWGKGFTMYGLLDEDEYTRVEPNQEDENYDAVVIPIHHTFTQQDTMLDNFVTHFINKGYSRNQIIVVDGWDREYVNESIAKKCTYYKREMADSLLRHKVKPISFAFPLEKIRELNDDNRTLPFAPLIPVNQSIDPSYMSTYKYDAEDSYYDMYQQSFFSYTSKKGGWDTLRHYEILANGSIPFFVDIEYCPEYTLWKWPKVSLCKAKYQYGGVPNLEKGETWKNKPLLHCGFVVKESPGSLSEEFNIEEWKTMRNKLYEWLKTEGSTNSLAEYILGNI